MVVKVTGGIQWRRFFMMDIMLLHLSDYFILFDSPNNFCSYFVFLGYYCNNINDLDFKCD